MPLKLSRSKPQTPQKLTLTRKTAEPTITLNDVYQEIKAASAHGGITARKLSNRLGLSKDRGPLILSPILAKLSSHMRKTKEGLPIAKKVKSEYVNSPNHPYAIQEAVYYAIGN
jgi:hypothetical protein